MSVEVSNIGFSAGHFLVGSCRDSCERLHGHNYELKVKVYGSLDENFMIVDFRILKRIIKDVCSKYDHKVLLPGKSRFIQILEKGNTVKVKVHEKEYAFPKEELLVLPISNTTTEELSRIICGEIAERVKDVSSNVDKVKVFLEELRGQGAWYTKKLKLT